MRVDKGGGVDIRGLSGATDGRSLVIGGDRLDRDARTGHFT
jgi:hypothetical protein